MTNLRSLALGAACLAALAAAPMFAGDGTLAVVVAAGTLGVGPELSLRPTEKLGVRASINWLSFARGADADDINFNGDLGLLSVGAMLDWYPLDGGIRVSAGGRWNGNDIALSATPSINVTVGGATYTPAEIGRLTCTVEAPRARRC